MEFIARVILLALVPVVVFAEGNTTNVTTVSEEDELITGNFSETTISIETSTLLGNHTENSTSNNFLNGTTNSESGNSSLSANETTTSLHDNSSAIFTTVATSTINSTDLLKCSSNLCLNGGTCLNTLNGTGFKCHCLPQYEGLRCENYDLCEISSSGKICENGSCVYVKGLRSCQCFLGDAWDDENKICRPTDPPCFPNPCLNGGTCIDRDDNDYMCACDAKHVGPKCEIRNTCGMDNTCKNGLCVLNEAKNYTYCKCFSTYYWNDTAKACKLLVPPCVPNPCKNDGLCTATSSNTFNCTCGTGYTGLDCQTMDYCYENEEGEICENGECVDSTTSNVQYCACEDGYYNSYALQKCTENQPPCHPNPCKNDGICIAEESLRDYKCICMDGYAGKDCSFLNRCILDGGNALCGEGNCTMDYTLGSYFCSCGKNSYFDYKFRECKALDMCPLMECSKNEQCLNSTCSCKENFIKNNDTNECQPNFCPSKPCPVDDMHCEENLEGDAKDFSCSCSEGHAFNGTHCFPAYCAFPDFNDCDQKCKLKGERYMCECYDSSFKIQNDNKTCKYVNNETCSNTTCPNGVCSKKRHDEVCFCDPGFSLISGKCTDSCMSGKLPIGICPYDLCETSKDGYRCKCEGKYILSKDETTCTSRRMCAENEPGWVACKSLNAKCIDDWQSEKGFTCTCSFGQESTDGYCRNICDVEEHRLRCSLLGATCAVDTNGKMICKCPSYLQLSENGTSCSQPAKHTFLTTLPLGLERYVKKEVKSIRKKRSTITEISLDDHLIWSDITESMHQLYEGFQSANVLMCKKLADYINCKIELQFQEENIDDLSRLQIPGVCQPNEVELSNKCLLAPSLVLRSDKIVSEVSFNITDPCDPQIKEDLCGSETTCSSSIQNKTFKCTCNTGFSVRRIYYPFGDASSFIEECKDVDECIFPEACPSSAKCINTFGGYLCLCLKGYRTKSDLSDPKQDGCIELCNPNPCAHGHCSAVGEHGFECKCDIGYMGVLCDLQDKNLKRAKTNSIIVGVVLGGILLLTVILFVAILSRLRKKKMLEDPNQMFYGSATEMEDRYPVRTGVTNSAFQRD